MTMRKDMGKKHKYVNGLHGFNLDKVFQFTFGEKSAKFEWNDQNKGYVFYMRDNLFDSQELTPKIEYFKEFWMVEIKPFREWEPQ